MFISSGACFMLFTWLASHVCVLGNEYDEGIHKVGGSETGGGPNVAFAESDGGDVDGLMIGKLGEHGGDDPSVLRLGIGSPFQGRSIKEPKRGARHELGTEEKTGGRLSTGGLRGLAIFASPKTRSPTRSPTTRSPTLRSTPAGSDALAFCHENKKKVYICHYNNVSGKHNTLCISKNAAPKHMKEHKNDAYGRCKDTTASPTTESPTTASPTTESPTTASPTTASPTTASPTTASPWTCEQGYELIDGNCTHPCDAGTHECSLGTMCFKTTGAYFQCLNPIAEVLLSPDERVVVLDLFHGSVFDEIAADAPSGITPGQVTFDQDPIDEIPLHFLATNSTVTLSGKFVPIVGDILPGTKARVYSQRGLHAETPVSESGGFFITLTDIIPGQTPHLLIFINTLDSTGVNQVSFDSAAKKPPTRRLEFLEESKTLFWVINNNSACTAKSTLTFKLTWNQPNDVDLHVYEPSGTEVYFNRKIGLNGELDFDDTDGFGPEHYVAVSAVPGQIYKARVHLWSGRGFVPVSFTLDAYYGPLLLWRQTGSLDEIVRYSEFFSAIIPANDMTCESCAFEGGNPTCCDHIDASPYWCDFYTCDDSHVTASWKVKRQIVEMEPSQENVLFFFNSVIAPMVPLGGHSYFIDATQYIRSGGGNYESLRNVLLEAYCKIASVKDMEFYLKDVTWAFDNDKEIVNKVANAAPIGSYLNDILAKSLARPASYEESLKSQITLLVDQDAMKLMVDVKDRVVSCGFKPRESIKDRFCLRSMKGVMDSMNDLIASYPNLLNIAKIGESYLKKNAGPADYLRHAIPTGGHDIFVFKVTDSGSHVSSASKGKFLMTSGIHPREYAPPELLARFIEKLVSGYGNDAEIRMILQRTEIHAILYVNPDGRWMAEKYLPMADYQNVPGLQDGWRKNLNFHGWTQDCKTTIEIDGKTVEGPNEGPGVDINRNFNFSWGDVSGGHTSTNPCDGGYMGQSAESEPETQALANYARQLFPIEQRKTGENIAGIYCDIHSYGEYVVFPWVYKNVPCPDAESFEALGRKINSFNHYKLWGGGMPDFNYAVSGGTKDYMYGVLGVAAIGLEIGKGQHDFLGDCSSFEGEIVPQNTLALMYAANMARSPFKDVRGPDILSISINPHPILPGETDVWAHASDSEMVNAIGGSFATGNQLVANVQLFLDVHPDDHVEGSGFLHWLMKPLTSEIFQTSIYDLAVGKHTFYVQATDSAGYKGPVSSIFFLKE